MKQRFDTVRLVYLARTTAKSSSRYRLELAEMGSRAANAVDEVGLPRVLVRSAALPMGFDGEFWSLSSPASSLGRQPRPCIDAIDAH